MQLNVELMQMIRNVKVLLYGYNKKKGKFLDKFNEDSK